MDIDGLLHLYNYQNFCKNIISALFNDTYKISAFYYVNPGSNFIENHLSNDTVPFLLTIPQAVLAEIT